PTVTPTTEAVVRPPAPVEPTTPIERSAPAPAARKRPIGAGVYVEGQTVFGPAPVLMPGVALRAIVALDRDGPWAPALIFGAMHVWRSDLAEQNGTASFTLDAGSLDVCPLRLRWWRIAARPCGEALVGRLAVRGTDTR